MTTYRDLANSALRSLKALGPGDEMHVDEASTVFPAAQEVILELHAAKGPLKNVDVTADYTAGENERVRVQDGFTVSVTLPNAVRVDNGAGTTASADPDTSATDFGFDAGPTLRAPRGGSRIEIVAATTDLFFYRDDTNSWVSVYTPAIDDPIPFNATDLGHLAALVAQRMIDTWPGLFEPTPSLQVRIGKANAALYMRPGVERSPVTAQYF